MSAAPVFEPRGEMSMKAACLEVFRGMTPGKWVSEADLVHQVSELTGVDCEAVSVAGAAWSAREVLAAEREVGVEHHMGGYKRLDVTGQVDAVDKRLRKTRRGLQRTASWAGAALANPELPPEQRHRLQSVERAALMQDGLEARRASRHRPLPPPGD